MVDLSAFDPNSAGNPNNNVFGLPFSEEEARLTILPIPWEVTVSFGSGTARSAEQLMNASLQVDLFDPTYPENWKEGFFMREPDKKVLLKSDYLRKEAELFIDYISKGEVVNDNRYIQENSSRIRTYFDKEIRVRQFEGESFKQIIDEIINQLPDKVYISFDIDGLDPKLCPNTGTPVQGGFETEQVFYLFDKMVQAGKQVIGFDLSEVSTSENGWDANVGARVLFKLCNLMVASNKA
jgi:arginase family enzyme